MIKGSELALNRPEGYLDKDTYHNLSHRTQGTFANQRESIYKLFNAYLKRKKERGDYDAADRSVMSRILREGILTLFQDTCSHQVIALARCTWIRDGLHVCGVALYVECRIGSNRVSQLYR